MEKTILVFSVLIFLFVIGILALCILTYLKVKQLQKGSCAGVPKFDPNSVYTKSIKVLTYQLNGKATFSPDNTFVLDFGGGNVYKNNKWIYDEDNCSLTISLNSDLNSTLSTYNSSVNNTVQINKQGLLVVNALIENLVPIQVVLDKN